MNGSRPAGAGWRRRAAAWAVPLLVAEGAFLGLALAGDLRARPARFLALQGTAFVAYLLALQGARWLPAGRRGLWIVLGAALLFRATLLPTTPTLSDDIYRYVWDGRVAAAGINPFVHAPDDEELAFLRDGLWERINHREIPTIYPPFLQGVFLAGALVSPSVISFKALMLLFELGIVWVVWRLVQRAGSGPAALAIYAWNPLVVLEVAGSGHNDTVAVLLLMAALLWIIQERRGLSMTALAGSILAKLVPLVVLPTFLRRVQARYLWALPLILVAGYLPFAAAGAGMFRGLSEYGHRWEWNDFVFRGLLELLTRLDPSPALDSVVTWLRSWPDGEALRFLYSYTHPQYFARALAFAGMLGASIYVSFKPWAPSRELLVALAAVLLLAPTVHPWYLLWLAPLLSLHPSRGLLLWTGLAPLSYAFPPVAGYEPYAGPLLFAEYVPVLALLAYEAVRFARQPKRLLPGLTPDPPRDVQVERHRR